MKKATRVLNFDKISSRQIKEVALALKKDGVIVCPTDTIYGISALPGRKKAVDRIYRIKKRDRKKRFILLASSIRQIEKVAKVSGRQKTLLEKIWPAPLTAILPLKKGTKNAAFRIPSNKKLLNLLLIIKEPIISTSANVSGKSHLSGKNLKDAFLGKVDYILVSPRFRGGKPSTIVDLTGNKVKVIRKGAFPVKKISALL